MEVKTEEPERPKRKSSIISGWRTLRHLLSSSEPEQSTVAIDPAHDLPHGNPTGSENLIQRTNISEPALSAAIKAQGNGNDPSAPQNGEERDLWASFGFYALALLAVGYGSGHYTRIAELTWTYRPGYFFLFLYLLISPIVAAPLLLLLFALGKVFNGSAVTSFNALHPRGKGIGIATIFISLASFSTYTGIAGQRISHLLIETPTFHNVMTVEQIKKCDAWKVPSECEADKTIHCRWNTEIGRCTVHALKMGSDFYIENFLEARPRLWTAILTTSISFTIWLGTFLGIGFRLLYTQKFRSVMSVSIILATTWLCSLFSSSLALPGTLKGVVLYFTGPPGSVMFTRELFKDVVEQALATYCIGFGVHTLFGFHSVKHDILLRPMVVWGIDLFFSGLISMFHWGFLSQMSTAYGLPMEEVGGIKHISTLKQYIGYLQQGSFKATSVNEICVFQAFPIYVFTVIGSILCGEAAARVMIHSSFVSFRKRWTCAVIYCFIGFSMSCILSFPRLSAAGSFMAYMQEFTLPTFALSATLLTGWMHGWRDVATELRIPVAWYLILCGVSLGSLFTASHFATRLTWMSFLASFGIPFVISIIVFILTRIFQKNSEKASFRAISRGMFFGKVDDLRRRLNEYTTKGSEWMEIPILWNVLIKWFGPFCFFSCLSGRTTDVWHEASKPALIHQKVVVVAFSVVGPALVIFAAGLLPQLFRRFLPERIDTLKVIRLPKKRDSYHRRVMQWFAFLLYELLPPKIFRLVVK